MLAQDVAWLVDLAGVMWGVAKVRAVAPTIAVLTLGEWLAVFNVVVISVAPCAEEGVVAETIGPGVIEVVVGMIDPVISHVSEGRHAVDDIGGNAIVGIGIHEGFDAFKVLLHDIF
jgi:hypothetical protein